MPHTDTLDAMGTTPSSPVTANKAVAREIAAQRKRREMTQKQVAASAGIPPGSYVRYETGQRAINIEILAAVAAALTTTPAELVASAEHWEPAAFKGKRVRRVRRSRSQSTD